MHMLPRRRWHQRPALRVLVGAFVVALLSVAIGVVHQQAASTQPPSIPFPSTPQLFVAGTTGSALLPFANDSLTATAGSLTSTATAVADTVDGALTVALNSGTPTATVMNAVTGAPVGSIALPEIAVAVAADPEQSNPDQVYIASSDALYLADLSGLPSAQPVQPDRIYPPVNQPPVDGESFQSIAVAPDGSTVYIGGAMQVCVTEIGLNLRLASSASTCSPQIPQMVNAVFAISTNSSGPCQTPGAQGCTWVAPYTTAAPPDTDFYGSIGGLR